MGLKGEKKLYCWSEQDMRAYQKQVLNLFIAITEKIFPDCHVTVEHSISQGVYCEVHKNTPLTAKETAEINAVMFREAPNYLSHSLPKPFELIFWQPGVIIRHPQWPDATKIPTFTPQPKLFGIFREAERWAGIMHCSYVNSLNDLIDKKQASDLIRVAEALHEKKLGQIADHIASHAHDLRVILIAGPSSSGKTTFVERLRVQLRVNGLRPLALSLDNYFLDRALSPKDAMGNYDFESLQAIDIALFNEQLQDLLQGKPVKMALYNFKTGKREWGKTIQLEKDQPVMIEGIHGLNEQLTPSLTKEQKYKVYISALTQLSISPKERIPTTDGRLLRRIVRDSQFRAHDAIKTLKMWPSVRSGEEKYIFPYQEEADQMFNSALIYELAVLKKYAEPLLAQVPLDCPESEEARRLEKFLGYFQSLPDDDVPKNSILREFIGSSCFHY